MKMNDLYPMIPQKNYETVVGDKRATIRRLVLAGLADPLEVEDMMEDPDAQRAIRLSTLEKIIEDHNGRGIQRALEITARWVQVSFRNSLGSEYPYDPRRVLAILVSWSPRLGAWVGARTLNRLMSGDKEIWANRLEDKVLPHHFDDVYRVLIQFGSGRMDVKSFDKFTDKWGELGYRWGSSVFTRAALDLSECVAKQATEGYSNDEMNAFQSAILFCYRNDPELAERHYPEIIQGMSEDVLRFPFRG